MSKQYLDKTGFAYFASKIMAALNGKSPSDHSHSAATQSAAGYMSAADKKKLDGVTEGANKYTLPKATSSALGGVKIGYPESGKNYPVELNSDGQMFVNVPWTDNNTTYSNMTGASSSAAGKAGLVPAPSAGAATRYLRSDGTWQVPPDTNTTYSAATQSAAGLMSAADKKKLDGVATGANAYTHPTTSGNKHIPSGGSSGQILRWSADGTAVWGADNNTTYSAATQSAAGLMSAADKKKLDGVATGANAYSHPSYTARTGVPTANQSPAFGGTFQVTQPVSDATGHITGMNSRTITMPSSEATPSAKGLMPAADMAKLRALVNGVTITLTGTNAYTATIDGITELTAGMLITAIPDKTPTANMAALNVNGLGAKGIRRKVSNDHYQEIPTSEGKQLYAGVPTLLQYTGEYWMMVDSSKPAANDLFGASSMYDFSNIGTLTAGDLNSATTPGTYAFFVGVPGMSASNTPVGDGMYKLIVEVGGYSDTNIIQTAIGMDGTTWRRAYTGNPAAWTDWDTPLLKSGGALTGALTVKENFNINKTYDSTEYKTYVRPLNYALGGEYTTGLIHYIGETNNSQLLFNRNGVAFRDNVAGKLYQLFGQHNIDLALTNMSAGRVAVGEYSGGGTTTKSISLNFVPQFFFIQRPLDSTGDDEQYQMTFFWGQPYATVLSVGDQGVDFVKSATLTYSTDMKTITISGGNAKQSFNISGDTYKYFAVAGA